MKRNTFSWEISTSHEKEKVQILIISNLNISARLYFKQKNDDMAQDYGNLKGFSVWK